MVLSTADVSVHTAPEPAAAWRLISRFMQPDDLICVTGSFFIAAEMRELLIEELTDSGRIQPISDAVIAG